MKNDRVKIIEECSSKELQEKVNEFIKQEDKQILDIQYDFRVFTIVDFHFRYLAYIHYLLKE